MDLKPGTRLRSTVDSTEVVVIRAPSTAVDLSCGGHPMTDVDAPTASSEPDPAWSDGTLLGKRYGREDLDLEVLCTRPGSGSLAVDGRALDAATSKPLPASD